MEAEVAFNTPYLTSTEAEYLEQVFATRQFAGNGPFTQRVQAFLEARLEVPKVLLTHSCTGALELAALRLELEPGDEVIVPSFTFVATASAFLRAGARIVFCEIDPSTMNLDPEHVASLVTDRTRAVVPVHYGGIGAPMDAIGRIAQKHGLAVVEDAAQGLGADIAGKPLGTFGAMGTLSFHETKNLHSGLGGALIINDIDLFDRAEDMWERGTNRSKMHRGTVDKYTWVELGSSFYPSELQAAFLLAQLDHLDANLAEREALYGRYQANLGHFAEAGRFDLPVVAPDRRLNWHSFFLIGNSVADTDRLRVGLAKRGIHAHTHYVPLHSSPMGLRLGYRPDDLPLTEALALRVLRLPMHNSLSVEDVDRVSGAVAELA